MSDDGLTPHGRLLETAREQLGYSKRRAAAEAGISEARWRQIVTGIRRAGGGVTLPVNPRPETLASMARAVDVQPDVVLRAAGLDAPPTLVVETKRTPAPARAGSALERATNAELVLELSRRLDVAGPPAARSTASGPGDVEATLARLAAEYHQHLERALSQRAGPARDRIVAEIRADYLAEVAAALAHHEAPAGRRATAGT